LGQRSSFTDSRSGRLSLKMLELQEKGFGTWCAPGERFPEGTVTGLTEDPKVRNSSGGEEPPAAVTECSHPWCRYNNPTQQIEIDGCPYPDPRQRDWGDLAVTTGYFLALGVPLLRGRYFDQTDSAPAPRAAIISQTMAKKYWQDSDPAG
jgi:hypothetical protein